MRRHTGAAHRAAALLGAGSEAEDVVQQAFVKAYRSLESFRDGARFRPWLLRIVVNEAKNANRAAGRRRNATERSAVLDVAEPVSDPASATLSRERRAELLDAVRRLPEPQRRVVICRFLLDLDEQETATVLGWPRGTVKSRTHRALRKLHRWLDAPPGPGDPAAVQEVDHE